MQYKSLEKKSTIFKEDFDIIHGLFVLFLIYFFKQKIIMMLLSKENIAIMELSPQNSYSYRNKIIGH